MRLTATVLARVLVFALGGLTGLSASQAVPVNDPLTPIRSFEVQTSHAGKGEWLVLEEANLGSAKPTYFLKQRRGKRTIAVTIIPKPKFDSWSTAFLSKPALKKKPSCPQPLTIVRTVQGKKDVTPFCMNQVERKALVSMGSTIKEMQSYVAKNDALKGRLRKPTSKK